MFANSQRPGHSLPTRVLRLFILSLFAVTAFAADECPPRYSYCGYSGPAQWRYIEFKDKTNECAGTTQSPINLGTPAPRSGEAIGIDYHDGPATIRNTGHDIEVTPARGDNKIRAGGKVYTLLQFHFHVPNEHRVPAIDNAVAEVHFLHEVVEGGKTYNAVIGVMLTSGTAYPGLGPVFEHLPEAACAQPTKVENFNFKALLPPETLTSYYTYVGSLTTPPCTEKKEKTVTWYVLDGARTIREEDKNMLAKLGANARPIQSNQLPVTYVRPRSN